MLSSTRSRRILFFFARALLSLFLWEVIFPRLGLRRWSQRTRSDRWRRVAVRFRALAIAMGGVLIKVGQFLSTRLDVLPEEVTAELAGLQDEVAPESFAAIRRAAEAELGMALAEKFASFEEAPLAAASLGQAHRATLREPAADGSVENVVVKVQRPGIEAIVATDLAALRTVGGWLQRYPPIRRRVDVPALLAEFTRSLMEELDYLAEGRNAETFAANFRAQPEVRIPRVLWAYTTRRVLTLEDVQAIKISDYAAITAAGIGRAAVARRLFDTYLQQIFRDGFFHADPHPGNLFLSPAPAPEPGGEGIWQLTYIDFGMVGHITPNVRAGLREAIIGLSTRDTGRMIKAYQTLGVLLPHADLGLIEKADAKLFERFWGKSMTELRQIDMAEIQAFGAEFRELLFDLPFQVPEDLLLLGRTVGILSGMCTGLDPNFNVWTSLGPFARTLMTEEATQDWRFWLNEAGNMAKTVLTLPKQAETVLGQMARGELAVRDPQTTDAVNRLDRSARRIAGSVIFGALLLSSVQLHLAGQAGLAGVLLGGAVLALGSVWWAR